MLITVTDVQHHVYVMMARWNRRFEITKKLEIQEREIV